MLGLSVVWIAGQQAEPVAHDLFLRWSAKPATNSPVTLILIDDESLAKLTDRFGPLPWPRAAYLKIFQTIQASHPAVMVFDSYFINPDGGNDASFFQALKQFPHLISGVVMPETGPSGAQPNSPLPKAAQLRQGVVSVLEDPDGVIRSVKALYPSPFDRTPADPLPALSLAAADEFQKVSSIKAAQQGTQPHKHTGNFGLCWEKILNPNRPEFAHSHLAIPLWRFFDAQLPPPNLSGKIALIGASSSFHRDYHKTPMANRHLGPDIHATAIDNILSGQTVHQASGWLNVGILALLCLMVFFLRLRYYSISRTLLYTLGSMVIYSWLVFWCLATQGLWLDVVTPLLFMLSSFLAASTWRLFSKEQQLAVMEKNLSQLVDPEVFREIRRLSHVLVPGGQKMEITSMFVDIRNFTALAESLPPHELTEILNEFYGETVKLVFSYQGTIDKFMGDGILIIFGAPLPHENHRKQALRAAHSLLEMTGKLCSHWRETGGIDTEIGITLNSGPAFVGFFGPANKLEYTGVGDTVNICIRLQEHAKQFNTRLILSSSVLDAVSVDSSPHASSFSHAEPYVSLGEVTVRGREGSLRIFTLPQAMPD